MKDTVSTLRILKLGSREEQSNYLTIWSKIALVCSEELKHGAYVWKQAVLQNVHDQILSNQKGKLHDYVTPNIYAADLEELKESGITFVFWGGGFT